MWHPRRRRQRAQVPEPIEQHDAYQLAVGLAIAASDRDDVAMELLLRGASEPMLKAVAKAAAELAASGTSAAAGGHSLGRQALADFAITLALTVE